MNLEERLKVARMATESVGAALMRLPRGVQAEEKGDQLKTAADLAAEGWVLGCLRSYFPGERTLAEEEFGLRGGAWDSPTSYWTVDALDGTRSFADGFDGFCVQVAWVVDGEPLVGVVHEPVLDQTYFATRGGGAFVERRGGAAVSLAARRWTTAPRFVDSTRPKGRPGEWFERNGASFVELGSIGLKICRIADGTADVFLKALRFRTWDVAPGAVILSEAGGRLGTWGGEPVPFASTVVEHRDILATHAERFDTVVRDVASGQ